MAAVANAQVTDGLFLPTPTLVVSNGQVWDGLYGDIAPAVQHGAIKYPNLAVRNVEARVLPQLTYQLYAEKSVFVEADATSQVCQGGYAFVLCTLQGKPLADAVGKFFTNTQTAGFTTLEGLGYARAPDFIIEDRKAEVIPLFTGGGNADVGLFTIEQAALTTNPLLDAWAIKNPTDEELALIVHTIRKRRK